MNQDFAKYFTTPVDMSAVFAAQQKNIDAFTQAGSIFAAATQAIWKRQAEMLQANVQEAIAMTQDLMQTRDAQVNLQKQMAFVKTQTEKTAAQVEELTSLLTKHGTEAIEVLRTRAEANVAEFKTLVVRAA